MKPALKKMRSSVIMSCLLAGACLGATGSARADAFAKAILTIDNFRVLHSSKLAYTAQDFASFSGNNNATVSATFNGEGVTASKNANILDAAKPDLAHRFAGIPTSLPAENDFLPIPAAAPLPGTFGYADQYMSGNMIDRAQPAGAKIQTRADALLTEDGSTSGSSLVGTMTSFKFMLGVADCMTFAFDATPFTQAYSTGNPHTGAMASVTWTLNLLNEAGQSVFLFAPDQLNAMSNVNRADNFPGNRIYAPGKQLFSATTATLEANKFYQLTISQTSKADAVQDTAVPEPASLAIFGLGLLGMSILRRRR